MKKICIPIFLLMTTISSAQINTSNQWTWKKGDSSSGIAGVYGTQGNAAAGNKPGARYGAVSWTDASGSLWMFGGAFISNTLNDLWKYSPFTNQWTWMKGDNITNVAGIYGIQGTAAAGNKPGARTGAVSWSDGSGNLWLFGGWGFATNGPPDQLNDLWKYDPSTNQWTWVKGDSITNVAGIYGIQGTAAAGNKPGARDGGVSWVDGVGNLWLFGGENHLTTPDDMLNDLWRYNPTTNEWTWMKGDNTPNGSGIYGTQGIAAAANTPGARCCTVAWSDATANSGYLWLFGGACCADPSGNAILNDLWKYSPFTNQWTWMKGDTITNVAGIYGTQGTSAIANKPGSRYASVSWKDTFGNLWLFGGWGFATGGAGSLNDLWTFDPSTNQWTWMKGESITNVAGIYGTQGTSAIANKPGSRGASVSWKDTFGNLWLFGGWGFATGGAGSLNDLWKIGDFNILPITLLDISAQRVQNNILVSWQTLQKINTSHFIVERSSEGRNFSTLASVTASGNTSSIRNYSFTDQHPFQPVNYYRLKIVDADGRFSYSKVVAVKMNATDFLQIFPNPVYDILFLQANGINENATLQITDATGRKLKEEKIMLNGSTSFSVDIKGIPKGVYYLLLQSSSKIQQGIFVKQ